MSVFDPVILKNIYVPPPNSHKGQNGKVLVVGGSKLFHAASLWSLSIASKIVDMVFYASVPENNEIVLQAKEEFRNGIVVPRDEIEHYAKEADCILVGPGLERESKVKSPAYAEASAGKQNFKNINNLESSEQTYWLTKLLLEKFPEKKFVLDAGSLQIMDPEWLLKLKQMPILTPHRGEFEMLFQNHESRIMNHENNERHSGEARSADSRIPSGEERDSGQARMTDKELILSMGKKYHCAILLKGQEDIVCSPNECVVVSGGNAGMTKGGTGDVLAGLTAALYAQNTDPFLVAQAASFLNKKAGESLFNKVGYYFNASDLVDEIPRVMKEYLS